MDKIDDAESKVMAVSELIINLMLENHVEPAIGMGAVGLVFASCAKTGNMRRTDIHRALDLSLAAVLYTDPPEQNSTKH